MLKSRKENGDDAHDLQFVDSNTFCCLANGYASSGFNALQELVASLPNALSTVC